MGEIIRIKKHESNYVILDRGYLEDDNISFKAKGILTYLLSRPNGWDVKVTDLIKRSTEGKCAVYSALKELEEHGYYTKKPVRSEDNSRILYWESTVHEVPVENKTDEGQTGTDAEETDEGQAETVKEETGTDNNKNNHQETDKKEAVKEEEPTEEPQDNFLISDFQKVDDKNIENRVHNKELLKSENECSKENCASDDAPHAPEHFFEVVWNMYPRKRGRGKVTSRQKKYLCEKVGQELFRALERYKMELERESWKQPQNGDTFFNSGYVDYLDKNYVPLEAKKPKTPQNAFNNFNQRSYDYDELERLLLSTPCST